VTPGEFVARPRVRIALAFTAVYLIWGSTYLAIAFAIVSIPPFLMAAARFLVAGGVLFLWARLTGAPRPTARQWLWAASLGALFFLVGNGAVVWVELRLPSGLTALLVALVSLWTAILEWLRPGGQRPTGAVVLGIVLGFGGVGLLVLPGGGGVHAEPGSVLLLMASTFAWALASVLNRGADLPRNTVLVAGMEMLAGGAQLLLLGAAAGELRSFVPGAITAKSALAFCYLFVFGSLVAFTCFAWLLRVTSPNKVATAAYVNPMVAVFLGWALGGEPLTLRMLVAGLVIVGSVILIISGREPHARPQPSPTPTAAAAEGAGKDRVVG
jgi:drug/metabolite transporter (DMT)-like permease